ncbi:unnamed protein product [Dovyalis caffra]|uniref:Uncharacterized protein n=1 Tax=Dovyalis caffra TaxID=77055 RepID=A0AAV1QRZ8_9ROSI|nr:unnamed protein product [Dovyalis caffra]
MFSVGRDLNSIVKGLNIANRRVVEFVDRERIRLPMEAMGRIGGVGKARRRKWAGHRLITCGLRTWNKWCGQREVEPKLLNEKITALVIQTSETITSVRNRPGQQKDTKPSRCNNSPELNVFSNLKAKTKKTRNTTSKPESVSQTLSAFFLISCSNSVRGMNLWHASMAMGSKGQHSLSTFIIYGHEQYRQLMLLD